MAVSREKKEELLAELKAELVDAQSLVLADYQGMSVPEVDHLRRKCEAAGVRYRVVKNTLARLALKGSAHEGAGQSFVGTIAVAYSHEDAAAPAKVLIEFAKELEKFRVKGGYFSGQALDAKGVEMLAKMPGKNEARAMLLGVLQAPAQQMVRVLAAGPQQVLNVLNARKDKLGAAA